MQCSKKNSIMCRHILLNYQRQKELGIRLFYPYHTSKIMELGKYLLSRKSIRKPQIPAQRDSKKKE